jgi:hypothetical protein
MIVVMRSVNCHVASRQIVAFNTKPGSVVIQNRRGSPDSAGTKSLHCLGSVHSDNNSSALLTCFSSFWKRRQMLVPASSALQLSGRRASSRPGQLQGFPTIPLAICICHHVYSFRPVSQRTSQQNEWSTTNQDLLGNLQHLSCPSLPQTNRKTAAKSGTVSHG